MTSITLDLLKYNETLAQMLASPSGDKDLITEAARKVSGDPTLVLTPAQRQQCKQAAYATLYGGNPIDLLGRGTYAEQQVRERNLQ